MKKYYTPEIEISSFDVEDIMMASGTEPSITEVEATTDFTNGGGFAFDGVDVTETFQGATFSW